MRGLDEWITGHYGNDQLSDIYCPGCGCNADEAGYDEVEGYFAPGVFIFRCERCGDYVQEGYWLNNSEAREKFYE